ncbi:PREDICTED: UPF0668 protein C10orf76 homolog [Acanthisitta chloris]|uniref:UPF0668 protein C10orf76 homolog n=1 Tax=Acanthisitta chloris TaxID=57068 RepID=UPI0004F0CF04|nr:PREDICTED: UPF0668 protein C10orf76 homolog [Acanthisitta chloris]
MCRAVPVPAVSSEPVVEPALASGGVCLGQSKLYRVVSEELLSGLWLHMHLLRLAGNFCCIPKLFLRPLKISLLCFRAIINHFNPKIESYAAVNHISQLSEDQVLEVVRSNYDTLTLKLQDGLDQYERYSEQHKEAAFFKELVRSISINVRKNLAFNTLSQELLLKEFSTIS